MDSTTPTRNDVVEVLELLELALAEQADLENAIGLLSIHVNRLRGQRTQINEADHAWSRFGEIALWLERLDVNIKDEFAAVLDQE